MAEVLASRGDTALVFRGDDGLDELTTSTHLLGVGGRRRRVVTRQVDPKDLGLALSEPGALRGGDRVFNARVVRDLLAGKPGAIRDAVLLTRGSGHRRVRRLFLALTLPHRTRRPLLTGWSMRWRLDFVAAREAIDSGAAARAPSTGGSSSVSGWRLNQSAPIENAASRS